MANAKTPAAENSFAFIVFSFCSFQKLFATSIRTICTVIRMLSAYRVPE
jgi:hypothetical protein